MTSIANWLHNVATLQARPGNAAAGRGNAGNDGEDERDLDARAGPSNTGGPKPNPPAWNPRRPGYADLGELVSYRQKYSVARGLPCCWGLGLLGSATVCCNMVYRGQLADLVDALRKELLKNEQEDASCEGLVMPSGKDTKSNSTQAAVKAFWGALEEEVRRRRAAAAGTDWDSRGERKKRLTKGDVVRHLPEFMPLNEKVEPVVIGGDDGGPSSACPSPSSSPWDGETAMRGQASVRVRPGQNIRAGEFIGMYSGEVWFGWEYPTLLRPSGTDVWDDEDHGSPYSYGARRIHEFDRYAVDDELPASLLRSLHDRGYLQERHWALFGEDVAKACKLTITAARLGCPVSMVNDPRRNLGALLEAEADFREGGPNVHVKAILVLEVFPAYVMVAAKDIAGGRHLMYDYGADYWALHAEQSAVCGEVEAVLRQLREERQVRQELEQELQRLRTAARPLLSPQQQLDQNKQQQQQQQLQAHQGRSLPVAADKPAVAAAVGGEKHAAASTPAPAPGSTARASGRGDGGGGGGGNSREGASGSAGVGRSGAEEKEGEFREISAAGGGAGGIHRDGGGGGGAAGPSAAAAVRGRQQPQVTPPRQPAAKSVTTPANGRSEAPGCLQENKVQKQPSRAATGGNGDDDDDDKGSKPPPTQRRPDRPSPLGLATAQGPGMRPLAPGLLRQPPKEVIDLSLDADDDT